MNRAGRAFDRVADDGVRVMDLLEGAKAFEDMTIHSASGDWQAEDKAFTRNKDICKRIELQILEYLGNDISAEEAKYRSFGLVDGFYQALVTEDLM